MATEIKSGSDVLISRLHTIKQRISELEVMSTEAFQVATQIEVRVGKRGSRISKKCGNYSRCNTRKMVIPKGKEKEKEAGILKR